MQKRALVLIVCAMSVFAARDADAQFGPAWGDRGYVNLSGAFESGSGVLADARNSIIYDEVATLSVASTVDSGAVIDISGGARVWRNVTVGLGYHRGGASDGVAVTGLIPHPLLVGSPRALTLNVNDLDRTEQAVHIQFGYVLIIDDRIDVHVTLGPSFFRLKQDVVTDVSISEPGGAFSTVDGVPEVTERTDSPVGFNLGADVSYRLYEMNGWKLGAGMFLRYTGASADVTLLENTVDSDMGGLQLGFGIRARF